MKIGIPNKLTNIVIALTFCIMILTPLLLSIIENDKDFSRLEKRKLSVIPNTPQSIKEIKKFPKLFDSYYSDHFGLREWFVKYYKLAKYYLGDPPSRDVTIGKNGWFFLGSVKKGYTGYSDPIGDFRGINLYSAKDLKKFSQHLSGLESWLKQRGIEYIFIIAPNKHTIYSHMLPDYLATINQPSATDQLVNYLKKYTNIKIIDLRKKLIEEKNKQQLYYKTDTHWNHRGANIAQYEIMQVIAQIFPNQIQPEKINLVEDIQKGGDLAYIMGVHKFQEPNPKPDFHNTCKPIYQPLIFKVRETYTTICEQQKLNAVIFRDSFFSALEPYFSRKFKRSTYIWEKLSYSKLIKYIDLEKPDIVIEQWVERSLPILPKPIGEFSIPSNKKLFECNNESIFSNHFDQLRFNTQLKPTSISGNSLQLKSIGKDPIIMFPNLPLLGDSQYILHIKMQTSVDSTMQLFYSNKQTDGYAFSEKNSIRININSTNNDIYLPLEYENIGRQLRLDPISDKGQITIQKLEIRRISKHQNRTCLDTKKLTGKI